MTEKTMGLATILTDVVQPLLARVGFKGKSYLWNRDRGGFIDVIEFQLGKATVRSQEQFTINAGVFVPRFYELTWGKKHKGFVREVDCTVRGRVGQIIQSRFDGKALDKWWHLDTEEATFICSSELPTVLTQHILPFLEEHGSFRHIYDFLSARAGWEREFPLNRLYLALVLSELGHQEKADSVFHELLNCESKAWVDRTKSVQSRLLLRTKAG